MPVIVQAERAGVQNGSPHGQDPSIDGAWFTTVVPDGQASTIEYQKVIEPRIDRTHEAIKPKRKEHSFYVMPSRRRSINGQG